MFLTKFGKPDKVSVMSEGSLCLCNVTGLHYVEVTTRNYYKQDTLAKKKAQAEAFANVDISAEQARCEALAAEIEEVLG